MTRKLLWIGIALFGITLAFGSNAWADRDRGDKGHRNDRGYHYKHKNPPGHHSGWHKGNGNPHRDRYQHRKAYRDRDRDHRWDRDRHHRWDRDRHYRGRHHPKRHRHVEKHVYHHYPKRHRHLGDRFNIAVSVVDEFLGVAVAVSGSR